MSWITTTTTLFQTESWATLLSMFTVFFLRSSKTECSTKRCASGDSARWSRGTVDVKWYEALYNRLAVSSKTLFEPAETSETCFESILSCQEKHRSCAIPLSSTRTSNSEVAWPASRLLLHATPRQNPSASPHKNITRHVQKINNNNILAKLSRTPFRPILWSLLLGVFSSAFAMFHACCKALDCAYYVWSRPSVFSCTKECIYSIFAPLQTINTIIEYYVRPFFFWYQMPIIEQYAAIYTVSRWLLPKKTDICIAFSNMSSTSTVSSNAVLFNSITCSFQADQPKTLPLQNFYMPKFGHNVHHFFGQWCTLAKTDILASIFLAIHPDSRWRKMSTRAPNSCN